MGRVGSLKQAFDIGLVGAANDKPNQRLEWLLVSTLTPVLASSAFATIHGDHVIGALSSIGAALSSSESSQPLPFKPGTHTRSKAYFQAIINIIKDVIQHISNATYPSICHVKMSTFKSTSLPHDHDPTWMTLRFAHVDDAIAVVSFLLSMFCRRSDSTMWPVYKTDDDQRIVLLKLARSLIELFLPNGILARKDTNNLRHISASSISILQLYQACIHCAKEAIPLLNCSYRYYSILSRFILEILYHHIMTLQRRCAEWNAGNGTRPSIAKAELFGNSNESVPAILNIADYRKEISAITTLESMLVECLISVHEYSLASIPNALESCESRTLVLSLLFSDQLLLLNDDESGKDIQRALLRIVTTMIPNGLLDDPLATIDYALKSFIHLERGILAEFMISGLEFAHTTENNKENTLERSGRTKKSTHSTDHDSANITSSSKRSLDDIEYDMIQFGQGPRGVQPQLSVNDLRIITVILYLWTRYALYRDSQNAMQKSEELASIVELIGKQYLRWVLSPGMHNASLNKSYLESSYPLILDIVASVSMLSTNESFKELLICLSSGPWLTDISDTELWSSMPMSPGAVNTEVSGERQLFNVIVRILERTAILTHLRDDPSLLHSCQSFVSLKCKALLVMSTLPYCQQLAEWRAKVIIDTLKLFHNKLNHACAESYSHSPTAVIIESLSILSSISPNMEVTIETVLGFLCNEGVEDDVLVTLASSMGVIACGVSTMGHHTLPIYSFDLLTQGIELERTCSLCQSSMIPFSSNPIISSGNTAEESMEIELSPTFLYPFQWLIRTCTTETSRLALLKGLYRVFCHLDINGKDLRSTEFGKFIIGQLDDQSKDIREAAGRVMRHLPEDFHVYNRLLAVLIDLVFIESSASRTTLILEEMSKMAKDKNLSHSVFLRPQDELLCTQVIQKLDAGQEGWLESLYSWTEQGHKNFLKKNVSGILPKLVILGSRDLIDKLAALMKMDAGTLCFEQLDHILSGIFMHENDDIGPPIELLRSLLSQVEQGGECQSGLLDIMSLITLSKVGLLIRLSLELGHESPEVQKKAKKIIEIVEENDWKSSKQQSVSKRAVERRTLASFLQQHILAILSEINKAIMDTGQRVTLGTKAKHLRSLSALVGLLQPIQRTVLSQIFSPLNMSLNIPGLRIHALRALKSIVDVLEPIQLDSLLDHLIQSLGELYLISNKSEQKIIFSILDQLLIQSQDKLSLILPDIGALPSVPEFEDMNKVLQLAKASNGFEHQLHGLINRLGSENSELAKQSALELKEFLHANEEQLLGLTICKDQEASNLLSNLVLTLLSEISRFRGFDAPVPMICAECLGIIGAIDPEKISGRRSNVSTTTVYTNLNDIEEARNFVCELITVQLVGKSRSIGDVPSESHWALALQELLSFCGITKDVLDTESSAHLSSRTLLSQRSSAISPLNVSSPSGHHSRRPIGPKSPKDRWRAFPRHVQEVLELLIDAKYKKTETSTSSESVGPLYPHVKTFQDWLTRWTLSLTAKVTGRNAKEIFQACKQVVPYDTATCLFILPHLVLHVLLEGYEKDQREIVNEMAAVLLDGQNGRQDEGDHLPDTLKQTTSELRQLGSQTAFMLFDHITKWIQQRRNSRPRVQGNQRFAPDASLQTVQNHLMSISHEVIARAAFRSKAYARALFHYEQYIRDEKRESSLSEMGLQKLYENYQQLYIWMDEPDGMEGISTLITSGTLNQYLMQCESAGRWEEALAYHELGLQTEPSKLDHHIGLYRTLDNLGQYDTLLNGVEGDIYTHPEWEESLNDFRISASWKSQRWESLDVALSRLIQPSFESGLGQLMKDLQENQITEFADHLRQTRSMLIAPLAAASMESYSRAYDHIVQLHMLHELEVAFQCWNKTVSPQCSLGSQIALNLPNGGSYTDRIRLYEPKLAQRLDLMATSFKTREQVALLRRIAFYHIRIQDKDILSNEDLQYLTDECGRLWLESARTARKSHNDQLSYSAMLHAEGLGNTSAVIERVKWGFSHNNERQAIKTIDSALKRGSALSISSGGTLSRSSSSIITRHKSSSGLNSNSTRSGIVILNTDLTRVQDRVLDKNSRGFIRAKAILLRTRWMDKSSLVSPSEITEGFRDAAAECESWEKVYYVAGQYFFKLYDITRRTKNRAPNLGYATQACRLYCKALSLGPKYLYQILPRLLTYWLDLGRRVHISQSNQNASLSENNEFKKINELMNNLADHLPEYMFLSAFPQIISRICHKNPDAFFALQRIIANVVLAYPDQAIWQMVSVSRSIVHERKRVCHKILHNIQVQPVIGPGIMEKVNEAFDLCDNLIALCTVDIQDKTITKISLEKAFPRIATQLKRGYNVTVPGQRSLWPTLPKSSETMASHQAFSPGLPKIDRFLDEIDVMSSLQRPRKITAVGSDGQRYTFLCKPKDDLRKDAKVMEVNSLVNTLLRKNREANRRDLYIRTYAVIPLNEECGLIEWVHNTTPYRHLVHKLYRLNNVNVASNADIKRILDHEDHVRLFTRELLPRFPFVFYQWFKEIAPEPTAWFAARHRFTRTAAVMSMAGYIVGLGDRHGENLLLDELNGDVVHVDFNCLFDAGKTFPKPERVPFRLTHNMVDGMGLSGYDGVFRISCEKTLTVFRDNTESLVSVLEGFLHDPLVEWSGRKRNQQRDAAVAAAAAAAVANGVDGRQGEDSRTRLLRGRPDAKAAAALTDTADGEPYDEQQSEKAQSILNIIKRKLNGSENQSSMFSLSVVGQVEELIQNATTPENLGKMYIGWSAYL
ncbi:serine/threonine-protein kinase M1 [Linnemannia zychae]|nr:serine/threonine-protein kinase M1 [Linnemannia zychae]